ncbi:hypothetical protein KSP40_PGU004289 [Platanthera guangdongensis]|uniref:Succinate dehydrogenase subunit 4 n=1 Tax=Platanthera guangdongensis TaxID=2320717 RepID=A0ABR2MMV7_9ASPA
MMNVCHSQDLLQEQNVKDYPFLYQKQRRNENELVAGYQPEYSGLKYRFFSLASYRSVGLLVFLFHYSLGWNFAIPYISLHELLRIKKMLGVFVMAIGIFLTLAKASLFLFIPITTRWTLPRMRMDQL